MPHDGVGGVLAPEPLPAAAFTSYHRSMTPAGTTDRKSATVLVNDEPAREVFRKQHKVRIVDSAKEGSSIHDQADGTYGFTYSPTAAAPIFASRKVQNFEIHRSAGGSTFIVGYVTAAELAGINKQTPMDLKLFPDAFQESAELVCLALDDVHARAQNSGQPGSPAPLRYEP